MTQRLALHLLGKPRIERDGEIAPAPKGKKVWGLLAFLVRSDTPPTRERLASLLFADAGDRLGALRWNLAELRRLLADAQAVRGEPVELRMPPGTFVDVRAITHGTWVDAIDVAGLGRDLLEGFTFSTSPAFESWLWTERRHLAAASSNVLREAVLSRLGTGEPREAVSLARRLVKLDPLDESSQSLLVRSLASSGDVAGAREQVEACKRLFRRELGTDPGPEITSTIEIAPVTSNPAKPAGMAAARAQIEAGRAAISAGAVEAGIECLRQATDSARILDDPSLRAEALVAYGSALIHSVRAHDDEGATALHEAISIGTDMGTLNQTATAHRELGYVEMLRARYDRAQRWASRALDLAAGDLGERAMALAVLGACLADTGRHEEALDLLTEGADAASEIKDSASEAFAMSFLARSHLMRGELDAAHYAARRSIKLAQSTGWTSFVPWPESLLGESEMLRGDEESAYGRFEHAFALGCQLGDPCWEGMGARGLGLLAAQNGDYAAALTRLDDARTRCVRLPDAYLWIEGYALDALCRVALLNARVDAIRWVNDLSSLAARTGMREFVASSYLYKANLGDADAFSAAAVIAAEVQNPALHQEIEAAQASNASSIAPQ